jgi:hypothetical protein
MDGQSTLQRLDVTGQPGSADHLQALAKLSRALLCAQDIGSLFEEALLALLDRLPVEYTKLLCLPEDAKDFRLQWGMGWKSGYVGQATVTAGNDSQAGYTLADDGVVIVSNFKLETRFVAPALLREHDVMSGMSVVVPGPRKPFGVLGVHSRKAREFTAADAAFLQCVANIAAAAAARNLEAPWNGESALPGEVSSAPCRSQEILNSWKEIAQYLNRAVRTAQRWEKDLQMPVHRPRGKARSAALAFTSELDDWLRRTPLR